LDRVVKKDEVTSFTSKVAAKMELLDMHAIISLKEMA